MVIRYTKTYIVIDIRSLFDIYSNKNPGKTLEVSVDEVCRKLKVEFSLARHVHD